MLDNEKIADEFCEECKGVYENWVTLKIAFEDLPRQAKRTDKEVHGTPIGKCVWRVFGMYYEAWISQVVRLHDPASQREHQNLSVCRIKEMDGWSDAERVKLVELLEVMKELPKRLKSARNKIVAHNDLSVRTKGDALGAFPKGLDDEYFRALAKLATMVWQKWCAPHYQPSHPVHKNSTFEFGLSARFESHFSLFHAHSRRNIVLFLLGPGTGNSAHQVPACRQLRPRQ